MDALKTRNLKIKKECEDGELLLAKRKVKESFGKERIREPNQNPDRN